MNLHTTAPIDPSKFRLLRALPDGSIHRGGLELLEGEGILWVDLTRQSEAELALLGRRFGFHPLALEDCAHLDQRPKIEEYDGYVFVVQHRFSEEGGPGRLALHELHSFLSADTLVTVHADPLPEVDAVWERASEPGLVRHGPDFLLYLILDRLGDTHFSLLDDIGDAIALLEDAVLERPARATLEKLFALKRNLVALRRTLSPARDVLGQLSRHADPHVRKRNAPYFRDVYDHLIRINEGIDSARDLLGNALEAYLSAAANRTNDIVKQLTIVSVIFLPLSFITGFFGQNFTELIPFGSPGLFEAMLGLCLLVPATMLLWFHHKKWF